MKKAFALLALVNVGCASIVTGSNQTLSVDTVSRGERVSGAQCRLVNDKGTWFVTTPGSVTVHRSYDALHVSCSKEGFASADYASNSSTKAMVFGNILFGGWIGAGVDVASGAAYDYPDVITFEMMSTQTAPVTSSPSAIVAGSSAAKPNCSHYWIGKDGRLTCSK